MRGALLTAALATLIAAPSTTGCVPERDPLLEAGQLYVEDPDFRREALEASLVNPDNTYAARRLAAYHEGDWGALPVHNPPTRPVTRADLGAAIPTDTAGWSPMELTSTPWTREALIELGRRAFSEYPMPARYMSAALIGPDAPAHYGLWQGDQGHVGGLRFAVEADGRAGLAMTCATCHTGHRLGDPGEPLIAGLANGNLDTGALIRDANQRRLGPRSAWGPGRVDVTSDGQDNPTAITDLRPVASQSHLHRAATLRNDPIALAIRIETLLITTLNEGLRPPRKLTFALALYLWSLNPPEPTPTEPEGQALFGDHCATCHLPPTFTGPPVAIGSIGTDPAVALSPERGTGRWRVPSLRGVSDRPTLTASGAIPDLDALLDPARTTPGHRFGLDLDGGAREALRDYLDTL